MTKFNLLLGKNLEDLLRSKYPNVKVHVLDDPASGKVLIVLTTEINGKRFANSVAISDDMIQNGQIDTITLTLEYAVRELMKHTDLEVEKRSNPSSREFGSD